MKQFLFYSLIFISLTLQGQSNVALTSPLAVTYITGDYDPTNLNISGLRENKTTIIQAINDEINSDSLKSYIIEMSEFNTRHSASDTVSNSEGIGAARRWAFSKFEEFSIERLKFSMAFVYCCSLKSWDPYRNATF